MQPPIERRVFGIGMNKTGTTSLKKSLRRIGIVPVAPNEVDSVMVRRALRALFRSGNAEPALAIAARYRTFGDRPWNVWDMYRRLDERFPDSRFILTVREPALWWRSVERWVCHTKPVMARRYLQHLRAADLSERHMLEGYHRYNQAVMDHFASSDKLLVIDLEQGDGWEPICGFLGLDVPDMPFPHANRQTYDEQDHETQRQKRLKRQRRRRTQRVEALGAVAGRLTGWLIESKPMALARNVRRRMRRRPE